MVSSVPNGGQAQCISSTNICLGTTHASTMYTSSSEFWVLQWNRRIISFIHNVLWWPLPSREGGFWEIYGCYCGAPEISPNVRFLWVSAVGLGVCQDIPPPSSPQHHSSPPIVATTSTFWGWFHEVWQEYFEVGFTKFGRNILSNIFRLV